MPRLTAFRLAITLLAVLVSAGAMEAWKTTTQSVASERECTATSCAEDFTALVTSSGGSGSGVLIDSEHVLTAAHVIDDGSILSVAFVNDLTPRRVISTAVSACDDIAVLRIEPVSLRPVRIAEKQAKIGDFGYVIGFPDQSYTTTRGQVRNSGVQLAYLHDLLQTDARTQPGNSGGPMLNEKGELIGLVTARVAAVDRIGFAIDIQAVRPLLPRLLKGQSTNATCQRFDEDCGWPAALDATAEYGCNKDGLYLSALQPGTEVSVMSPYAGLACGHYVLRARSTTKDQIALGVIVYVNEGDYLVAAVSTARDYGLFRVSDGGTKTLQPYTHSDKVRADGPNDLTLEVDGAKLTLSINDTKVDTVTDGSLGKETRFGLYGRSFPTSPQPATGYFAWTGFECRD